MKNPLKFLLVLTLLMGRFSGETFAQRVEGSPFPLSARPDKLYLTSNDLPYSHKISMLTLAGILAKTKPELLWEIGGHRELVEKAGIPIDRTYFNDYPGLLRKYAPRLAGYILCNARERSVNVAVSLAGILNAVAIPADMESVAIDAGLTRLLDVRGRDEIWMMDNYGSRFNKNIASYQAYMDDRATALSDFTVYTGAAQFWDDSPTGPYATKVYNSLNRGAVFMGYIPDEFVGVNEMSKRSFSLIPSDWARNLSTLSNIPVPIKKQQDPVTPYKVVPNVHTVCFVLSDGDNVAWTSGNYWDPNNFSNPVRANINMGFTMAPSLVELAPLVYNEYIDRAITTPTGRNVLIAGPSGDSYFFPTPHPDPARITDRTNRYLKQADLKIVNVLDVDGAHNPEPLLRQPNIDALFYYSYGAQYIGLKGEIKWYKDKPSIGGRFNLWGGNDPSVNDAITSTLARELNQQSTNINAPEGYSLIPVHVWSMNVTEVYNTIRKLNPNVRVVAPDEFVWLIKRNLRNVPMGNGNGLKAEYFKGYNFNELKYTEANQAVDVDWGTGSPNSALLGNDQFSVRWSGQIMPLYSQEYTFYTTSDDGVRLTVNGQAIINDFATQGAYIRSGRITLTAGQRYDIKLEYGEGAGNAFCSLEWESASQARQIVPKDQLFSRTSSTGGVTVYDHCNYDGVSTGLYLGNYTLSDLSFRGIPNDQISSVKVAPGYKAVLYEHDNFQGQSVTITADNSCLVGNGWNDRASSLKITGNGITNMPGPFFLQNRNSGLYMDVVGGPNNVNDAADVQQWNTAGTTNQAFRLLDMGDGTVQLQAAHSGKALSAMGLVGNVGFKQATYTGAVTQKFILLKTTGEYYKLIVAGSGKVVDVANASQSAETPLIQNTDNNQLSAQWKLVPAPNPSVPGDGLTGNYFNGMNFETPVFTRRDEVIHFNWDQGAPGPNINPDGFSVRWTGQIRPRYTGQYTFYVNSDNGRRLWVNGQLIIDQWISDWGTEYSGTITLNADQKYDIKLEYFEDFGGAGCQLSWSHASQPKEIIPRTHLYATGCTACRTGAGDQAKASLFPENELRVYPNPVETHLMVHLFAGLKGGNYTIVNMTGAEVAAGAISAKGIPVSALSPGLYTLLISDGKRQVTTKFIKK